MRGFLRARGAHFEQIAEAMLQRAGLKTIQRNFCCKVGEIDLIMEDASTLVFVEVRFRETTDYGEPLDTITRGKQRRIIRAAHVFLQLHPRYQQRDCRFDAVGITGTTPSPEIRWITNAFSA